jgi:hypothetical protein
MVLFSSHIWHNIVPLLLSSIAFMNRSLKFSLEKIVFVLNTSYPKKSALVFQCIAVAATVSQCF